jgi:AraC-like DNA-binding protein
VHEVVARASVSQRAGPSGRLGRVRAAGRVEDGRGVPTGPLRRFDGYAVACVVRGRGRYRDPAHDVPLEAGDLVVVVPGHPHWYGVVGPEPWDEVHLVFDGPVFDLCARQGLLDVRAPVRRLRPAAPWVDRIDAFRTRRAPRTAAGVDDEVCDVLRLLVDVAAHGGPAPVGGGWLAESQARLAADLGEPLALPDVAAAVGMPYQTWRKRFRAATGSAPARYRLLRRVDAARDLLRRTSMGTRDIAASLGFTDEHHLSRQFRRTTGRTAGEYRRDAG